MNNYKLPSYGRILPRSFLAAAAAVFMPAALHAGVTLHLAGPPGGAELDFAKKVCAEWAQKTGNTVELISRPSETSQALTQFQQYWSARSGDVDIYQVDVIWQGICAPHAVDLKKYYKDDEISQYFPRIIQNNTVKGKLVSIPLFVDAGILYYRTDLLQKYGYSGPPKTWDELTEMATKIMNGERQAGKSDFYGFVFQGESGETVTCDAIEWVYSNGGGTIIEPDRKVSINNPNAIKALEMAHSWVGKIAPAGVVTYDEEPSRNVWQAGNSAFMRNWPYAYALGQDPKSPIAGKFDVTVLPKGSGPDGKNAACLGGWQLMVSAYSKNPDVAADLVKFMSSPEIQKQRAIELSMLPTRPSLFTDPDVLAKNPWFKNMSDVLQNAVARPSTVTGADYNQISTSFFQNVNQVLSGTVSAPDAVKNIEKVGKRLMR